MSFYYICLNCGKKQLAGEEWKGQRKPCPRCGKMILIRKDPRLNRDIESDIKQVNENDIKPYELFPKQKDDFGKCAVLPKIKNGNEPLFDIASSNSSEEKTVQPPPLPTKTDKMKTMVPKKGILKPLGRKKGEQPKPPPIHVEVSDKPKYVICPVCRHRVCSIAKICAHCGTDLSKQ